MLQVPLLSWGFAVLHWFCEMVLDGEGGYRWGPLPSGGILAGSDHVELAWRGQALGKRELGQSLTRRCALVLVLLCREGGASLHWDMSFSAQWSQDVGSHGCFSKRDRSIFLCSFIVELTP